MPRDEVDAPAQVRCIAGGGRVGRRSAGGVGAAFGLVALVVQELSQVIGGEVGEGGPAQLEGGVGGQRGVDGDVVELEVVLEGGLPEAPLVGLVPNFPVADGHVAVDVDVGDGGFDE